MPIRIVDIVRCWKCGNVWSEDKYEELRPIDATIGYCPSCGEDGDAK